MYASVSTLEMLTQILQCVSKINFIQETKKPVIIDWLFKLDD